MTYRVLVPLDGSNLAERAIPWADELAGALQADVELLRVVPHDLRSEALAAEVEFNRRITSSAAGQEIAPMDLVEAEESEARRALSRARGRFRRARVVEATVLHGSASEQIVSRAQIGGATLVAMASHGRSGLARALMGSVAEAVIRRSGVPVLVIRANLLMPPHLPRRVLVPLDTSVLAEAALHHVVPLARELKWTLVLCSVVDPPAQTLPVQGAAIPLGWAPQLAPADFESYLDRVAGDLRSRGLEVEVQIAAGDRAEAIMRSANETQCRLIAMSTHGRHGLGRWALGSVTDAVIQHAEVPVLAVRPLQVPMSSAAALHLAERTRADGDGGPMTVTLTGRQARVVRLALEHLTWSASRHEGALEDIRGALVALDEAEAALEPEEVRS